jgi:hypothetical protein
MSLLEIGKTGASRQSWRSPSARALLRTLMDDAKDPHAGKVLFSEFLNVLLPAPVRDAFENEDDERRLIAVVEYWFTNNYDSLLKFFPRPEDKNRDAALKISRAAKETKIREAVRDRIVEKAEMLLLDCGKAMGDCTGAEVKQFGRKVAPWLTKISAKVKPNERVRDVLNEADVRKMWGR